MKTITFLVSAILTLGSCTSNSKSKEPFTSEDQEELQRHMLSIVHDNDSDKTIYYEDNDNVYKSQFYNTTQALVRKSFDNETLRSLFLDAEIQYLWKDGLPTMDELQETMKILVKKKTFWNTIASDPLWYDCKYLAANTKYWRIYYTSKKEQAQYIKYFENTHHFISEVEHDLHNLPDPQITIEL